MSEGVIILLLLAVLVQQYKYTKKLNKQIADLRQASIALIRSNGEMYKSLASFVSTFKAIFIDKTHENN